MYFIGKSLSKRHIIFFENKKHHSKSLCCITNLRKFPCFCIIYIFLTKHTYANVKFFSIIRFKMKIYKKIVYGYIF